MRSGAIEAVNDATVVIAGRGIPPTILDVHSGAEVAQCQPLHPQEWADLAAMQRTSLEPVGPQHMDVSPDGSMLLVSDSDRPVSLWSLVDLKELRAIASHGAGISGGVFLNDGRDIATAGHDGRVLLTPTEGGSAPRVLLEGRVPVRTLAASRDRTMLAAGLSDGRVCLWRDLYQAPLYISAHTGIVFALTFDQSGTLLATGSPDQFAAIWRVSDGSLVQRVASESGTVRDLDFDAQGALYILGWWRVARLVPGAERPTTVVSEGGWHFAMPRDGEMIVVSNNEDSIRRWRMNGSLTPVAMEPGWMVRRCIAGASPLLSLRGREISARRMDGAATWTETLPTEITAFTASADGSCIAAGLADKSVWIRQHDRGFRKVTDDFESGLQHVLALDATGARVAFRTAGNGVGLVDLRNEAAGVRQILPPTEQEQMVVRFSADGARLIEAGRGGTIRTVDLSTGQVASLETDVTVFVVESLRNGTTLLGAWTGPILVVDRQHRVVQILRGHSALVRSVAQHPTDPDLLLSGSMDGTVRLWHLGLGREFQSITPFGRTPLRTAGFNAEGTHIIAASEDGRVCTWPLLLGDEYIQGNMESQRQDLKGSFPSSQAIPPDQRHPSRRPD
jgi:WD40 repeat protein